MYSWLSLFRPRLSRITAYLEVKISLPKHEHLIIGNKILWKRGEFLLFSTIFSTYLTSRAQLHIYLLNAVVRFFSSKKVREKSRECHNHKPQPFPDPKRKRKPTNLNKHKPNKRTKSTKISSLFPKRGNRNTKRIEKHKIKSGNLMCRGTDISKYFRESLGIRDNDSQLYFSLIINSLY